MREKLPIRMHRSAHLEAIANHNEGFVEGLCDAIDALHELGRHEVAEELLAYLFSPARREAAE